MARNSRYLSRKIAAFFARNQFVGFVLIVIAITFLLTFISLKIYVATGAQRLDLSRPGYEDQREKVRDDKQNRERPFSETGKLDAASLRDFRERLKNQRAAVNEMDDFSTDALSDENLGLSEQKTKSQPDNSPQNQ